MHKHPEQTDMDHIKRASTGASLLSKDAVLARAGIGTSRLYELVAAQKFPPPVKLGKSSRWVSTEVDAWVGEQIARRDLSRVPLAAVPAEIPTSSSCSFAGSAK